MLYQKLWFILFTRFHNLNVFEERIKLVIIFVIFDGIIFTWNIIDCFDLICHFFIEALQLSQFFYIKTIIFIRKIEFLPSKLSTLFFSAFIFSRIALYRFWIHSWSRFGGEDPTDSSWFGVVDPLPVWDRSETDLDLVKLFGGPSVSSSENVPSDVSRFGGGTEGGLVWASTLGSAGGAIGRLSFGINSTKYSSISFCNETGIPCFSHIIGAIVETTRSFKMNRNALITPRL